MPAHKHTMLQICIICVLCYVLGLRLVWQYPEFFNGAGHNNTDRFITLGSATSTEDSGFLITSSRYSEPQPDKTFTLRRLEPAMLWQ
jgi:hypothetical protein